MDKELAYIQGLDPETLQNYKDIPVYEYQQIAVNRVVSKEINGMLSDPNLPDYSRRRLQMHVDDLDQENADMFNSLLQKRFPNGK